VGVIGHLSKQKTGHLTSYEIVQLPDVVERCLCYTETKTTHRCAEQLTEGTLVSSGQQPQSHTTRNAVDSHTSRARGQASILSPKREPGEREMKKWEYL
jgi:hypothetical protein